MMRWLVAIALLLVAGPVYGAGLPVFDVTQYGATPNDATDDTTAIQAAIADADASNAAAVVNIPRGVYMVSVAQLGSGCQDIVVEGNGAILKRTGNISTGTIYLLSCDRCTVRNLLIDGNDFGGVVTNSCIHINGASSDPATDNLVENCYLYNTWNGSTAFGNGLTIVSSNVVRTTLRNVDTYDTGGDGIRATTYDTRIEYCDVAEYHNRGFRMYDGTRLWMNNCSATTSQPVSNGGCPCLIDPGAQRIGEVNIADCFFYINRDIDGDIGTQALKVAHVDELCVERSTLKASWSRDTTHRAVRLEDSIRRATFRNCRIRGNFFMTETGHGGILSQAEHESNSGAARTGSSSTTIRLAITASTVDDFYNYRNITLTGGTSNGDVREITDYDYTDNAPFESVGTEDTFTATVGTAFTSTPDLTTTYRIEGDGFVELTCTGDRVIIDAEDSESQAQELYVGNSGVSSYNGIHKVTDVEEPEDYTDNGAGTSPRYEFNVVTNVPYTSGSIEPTTAYWRSTPDVLIVEACQFGDEDYDAFASICEGVTTGRCPDQTGMTSTQITLGVDAFLTDDVFNGLTLSITAGPGTGQSKTITDYDGPDRIATVNSAWSTQPTSKSRYSITQKAESANRQACIENLNARVATIRKCRFNGFNTNTLIEWAVDQDAYFDRFELVDNEFRWKRSSTCLAVSPENCTNSLKTSGKVIAFDNRLINMGSGTPSIVRTSSTIETGVCGSGSTTTAINIGEAASGTEIFEDKVLTIGAESRRITAWNNATTTATVDSAFGGAPSNGTEWTITEVVYTDRTLLFSTDGANSRRFITTTGSPPDETATGTNSPVAFSNGDVALNNPNNSTKQLAWVYTTGGWLGYGDKPTQTLVNSGNTPYAFTKAQHGMTYRVNSTNCEIDLPAVTTSPSGALAGLRVTVILIESGVGSSNANADTGDALTIDPNGSEIIVLPGATNSAGKALRLDGDTDRVSDTVTLEAGT